MSEVPNGDTLDQNNQVNTPPAGSNTPPQNGESQPSSDLQNELERERSRAATALREKSDAEKRARDERVARLKAEKQLRALQGEGGDEAGSNSSANFGSSEEAMVRANAEKQIYALIASTSAYQQLLDKDSTLKDVILRNPLSLISEYIDAEDAAEQVQGYLDGRIQTNITTPPTPSSNAGSGDQQTPQNPPAPGAGNNATGKADDKYSAESIKQMSPEEWNKIPKDKRMKMLQGDFS